MVNVIVNDLFYNTLCIHNQVHCSLGEGKKAINESWLIIKIWEIQKSWEILFITTVTPVIIFKPQFHRIFYAKPQMTPAW